MVSLKHPLLRRHHHRFLLHQRMSWSQESPALSHHHLHSFPHLRRPSPRHLRYRCSRTRFLIAAQFTSGELSPLHHCHPRQDPPWLHRHPSRLHRRQAATSLGSTPPEWSASAYSPQAAQCRAPLKAWRWCSAFASLLQQCHCWLPLGRLHR